MCYVKNPSNPACQEAFGLNLKGAIGGKYGIISLPTNSINAITLSRYEAGENICTVTFGAGGATLINKLIKASSENK